MLAVGIAFGLVISAATTRALQSLLFGVEPADPLTFAGMSLALTLVGLIACFFPALRASRVAPIESLKAE